MRLATHEASGPEGGAQTIFELLTAYHRSLDAMKQWLDEAGLSDVERISIADAWQAEMTDWFREQGYCFACNRPLRRCGCAV
ncbi:MAG: hypothetical protein JSV80_02800 [Acidobacteriota bacterium]|nr:MAG: hypothetical protein JSV80_02800 [Acidobacteriota bacterium]